MKEASSKDNLIRKVGQCDYNCPYYINSKARALFKRILCPNPNDRITMDELKMDCIYNMGKANFLKYYKIFGNDGDLLPQVKKFIKEKAINYLETECSMEVNDNIENITSYKIFFHTFMHKTKWEMYHIPKNNEQNIVKIEKNKENENVENKKDNIKENNTEKNEEVNEDILYIPPHETISNAISKTFENNREFKINLNEKDIDAMRKLGILSHSFDANWMPKNKYQENMYNNINNDYIGINDNEYYTEYRNAHQKPYKGEIPKPESQGSYGTTAIASQKILNQGSNSDLNNKI